MIDQIRRLLSGARKVAIGAGGDELAGLLADLLEDLVAAAREELRHVGLVGITAAAAFDDVREALEESGLHVRLDALIDIYSYPGRAPVVIVYAATMTGGCLACDDEGLEARFFAREQIPWDQLAFRSTREALEAFFEAL